MIEDTSHPQKRYSGILLLFTLALIGTAVWVLRSIQTAQGAEARRVAYAATATQISLPATPTPLPSPTPTGPPLSVANFPTPLATPLPTLIPLPGAPAPASPIPHNYDLINILALGSDRWGEAGATRTDVILLISLNRTTQTVSLLSIPRDLYVYIPGWGMDRINAAEVRQVQTHQASHPLGLLAETVEYNFGLQVHHLARVDFDGFRTLVDHLGGVSIPVDCPLSGYRLASPDLNPDDLGNWAPFTLEPGVHQMDGSLALWYVRQRVGSSDFDRNRRQQMMMRALWRRLAASDFTSTLPAIWDDLTALVETDLALQDVVGLLPLLFSLDSNRVESHFLGMNEVNPWNLPDGSEVLVPDPAHFQETMIRFLTPPTDNRLVQELAQVEVLNGSTIQDADHLAAARLEWMGFVATPEGNSGSVSFPATTIYDHTGRAKGTSLSTLQSLLGVPDEAVIVAPDTNHRVDFTVVVGDDYTTCAVSPWRPFVQSE